MHGRCAPHTCVSLSADDNFSAGHDTVCCKDLPVTQVVMCWTAHYDRLHPEDQCQTRPQTSGRKVTMT